MTKPRLQHHAFSDRKLPNILGLRSSGSHDGQDTTSTTTSSGLGIALSPTTDSTEATSDGIHKPQQPNSSHDPIERGLPRRPSTKHDLASPSSGTNTTRRPSLTRKLSGFARRASATAASEAGYYASTESERSNSVKPSIYQEQLPSLPLPLAPDARRAALISTSTRTTESAVDVYASAETSLHHLPASSPPPPNLPPLPDWFTTREKAEGGQYPDPAPRSRRQLHPQHHLSRSTVDSNPAAGNRASSFLPSDSTTAQPSSSTALPADTRPLASLYMVCGLPKDPQCWTLAQPEYLPAHLDGAVPRFWRPEVLGTTLSGQDADLLGTELDRRRPTRSTRSAQPPDLNTVPAQSSEYAMGKEELARVQAKAMKLAFAREVEVIASTVQPPSTTHCFSFIVPAQTAVVTDATGAIGQQWDLALAGATGETTRGRAKTYYGACLQVWSHADRGRSEAIRRAVEEGSKAKSAAIARAVKAAAAGKRLGARLERAAKSAMGPLPTPDGLAGRNWNGYASTGGETDTDTEGFCSESEWDGPASMLPVANLPGGLPFWLPYCLVLVSRMPIYDLMVDHLRISWARYHQAIGKHSQQMLKMLNLYVFITLRVEKDKGKTGTEDWVFDLSAFSQS